MNLSDFQKAYDRAGYVYIHYELHPDRCTPRYVGFSKTKNRPRNMQAQRNASYVSWYKANKSIAKAHMQFCLNAKAREKQLIEQWSSELLLNRQHKRKPKSLDKQIIAILYALLKELAGTEAFSRFMRGEIELKLNKVELRNHVLYNQLKELADKSHCSDKRWLCNILKTVGIESETFGFKRSRLKLKLIS